MLRSILSPLRSNKIWESIYSCRGNRKRARLYSSPAAKATRLPYSRPKKQIKIESVSDRKQLLNQFLNRFRLKTSNFWVALSTSPLNTTIYFCYYCVNTILIVHVIWNNFYSINGCLGPSMLPTLNVDGDWVVISKLHAHGRGIKVGDLVSYDHPVRLGTGAIKRVIGMPGDLVLRDTPGRGDGTMIKVPKNHCWVMGDNIDWTRDSRHFGPLPLPLVRGKVIARILPWHDRKWINGDLEEYESIDAENEN